MKKKRLLALIMAGTLLAGQTVYAQEAETAGGNVNTGTETVTENETEYSGGDDIEETDEINLEEDDLSEEDISSDSEKEQVTEDSSDETETDLEATTKDQGTVTVQDQTDASVLNNAPDDEAVISDENLKSVLMKQTYYDSATGSWISFGEDGYVSVAEIEKLTTLYIYATDNVTDVSGLKQAVNLQTLSWNCNDNTTDISSLSELSSLSKLTILSVHGNGITDISALSDLIYLENVFLSDTAISDVSP